jgi:hypothetical protein
MPAEMLDVQLNADEKEKEDQAYGAQDVEWTEEVLRKQRGRGVWSDAAEYGGAEKDAAEDLSDDS